MDIKALFQLSYGLYLLESEADRRGGCIVNTLCQVANEPPLLTVAVNKSNYTAELIDQSGRFQAHVLTERAPMELIARFGFQSGRDVDKFDGLTLDADIVSASLACEILGRQDAVTHWVYLAKLVDARIISDQPPMTYAYYHQVKRGVTPKNAATYQAPSEAEFGWRCTVCGHVEKVETLPEGYRCPICKQPASVFVKLGVPADTAAEKPQK
ncbi:MAG TPA: flavin reductase [Clostridia bacterium]|nr:flavin reductase [Clostridia bacterium]